MDTPNQFLFGAHNPNGNRPVEPAPRYEPDDSLLLSSVAHEDGVRRGDDATDNDHGVEHIGDGSTG
jgi:hypothetical protein